MSRNRPFTGNALIIGLVFALVVGGIVFAVARALGATPQAPPSSELSSEELLATWRATGQRAALAATPERSLAAMAGRAAASSPGTGYSAQAKGRLSSVWQPCNGCPWRTDRIDYAVPYDSNSRAAFNARYSPHWLGDGGAWDRKQWQAPQSERGFIVEDALSWACSTGRTDLLGADPAGRDCRTTGAELSDAQATNDSAVWAAYYAAALDGGSPERAVHVSGGSRCGLYSVPNPVFGPGWVVWYFGDPPCGEPAPTPTPQPTATPAAPPPATPTPTPACVAPCTLSIPCPTCPPPPHPARIEVPPAHAETMRWAPTWNSPTTARLRRLKALATWVRGAIDGWYETGQHSTAVTKAGETTP